MCDVIDRIEEYGLDLDQLLNRHDPRATTRSGLSITLIVMAVVEDEWKKRLAAEGS